MSTRKVVPMKLPQLFGPVCFQQQDVWFKFLLLLCFIEIPVFNANSVDPDQKLHQVWAQSDLRFGRRCHLKNSKMPAILDIGMERF